jgi:hypothetical protein
MWLIDRGCYSCTRAPIRQAGFKSIQDCIQIGFQETNLNNYVKVKKSHCGVFTISYMYTQVGRCAKHH